MNAATQLDWDDANQRVLVAEFARVKAHLGAEQPAAAALRDARATLPAPATIDVLGDEFGLSAFERDLLLLCAAVEMDSAVAPLCAERRGPPHQAWVSFGLALATLPDAHWSALAPISPLRRWRLLEPDSGHARADAPLRLDERILHYLAGLNYLDPRLQPLCRPLPPAAPMAATQAGLVDQLVALIRTSPTPLAPIQLVGDDADGKQDVASALAERLQVQTYRIDARDLPATAAEMDALLTLWWREAILLNAALLLDARDPDTSDAARRLLARCDGLLLVATPEPLRLDRVNQVVRVDRPAVDEQRRLWEAALGANANRLNGAIEGVAAQFRLSARQIEATGAVLGPGLATTLQPDAALWQACRGLNRTRLDALAQRIEPAATWDDLILPDPQRATLREIAAHVRHRSRVYQDWGFARQGARGLGISALFAGESGTGKTMAAEVLATELTLDLYRIDLAAVVSKYIGETEKNLAQVFAAAEESGAILLFDEADALFGKRSEVRDSHDRYANLEVSYLLQRMEAYRGLAILTTNQRAALDPAFQRRLRFIVQFPFPDTALRERIWRRAFPLETPRRNLNPTRLAQLQMAGGNIRNIALNAAFLAAAEDTAVDMSHLLLAAHREATKRERPLSDSETRGWL